jgi:acyl-CoA reductase-like NAD-dependent aldehyde dehydrogenase
MASWLQQFGLAALPSLLTRASLRMSPAEEQLLTGLAVALHVAAETAPDIAVQVATWPFMTAGTHLERHPHLS